jgi:tetratricopeptide (TPR) repeat protein
VGTDLRDAGDTPPADLALRMIAENRFDVAYRSLEDLVQRGEESAEVCLRLAWIAWAVGDERAVETWCHESERLDESSAEPHLLLGLAQRKHGRWAEALEEFEAGLRRKGLSEPRRALLEGLRAEMEANIPEW